MRSDSHFVLQACYHRDRGERSWMRWSAWRWRRARNRADWDACLDRLLRPWAYPATPAAPATTSEPR